MTWVHLPHRAVLKVTGRDRKSFLQGLLTNDLNLLTEDTPLYSALLSPQGKFLHDLFLTEQGESLFLEGERERLPDLMKRLSFFKLRANVVLTPLLDLSVLVGLSTENPEDSPSSFKDPRKGIAWRRAYVSEQELSSFLHILAGLDVYHQERLTFGVPEGSLDMTPDKAIPLECGLDDLGAIDWNKGCYMGQELTARTKHRGLVRKRFLPFVMDSPVEETSGKELMQGDKKVGVISSTFGTRGIARLRLEALELKSNDAKVENRPKLTITLEGKPVQVIIPEWVRLS